MTDTPTLRTAQADVQAARARLFSTLGEVQSRLRPSNIAHDAMESAAHGVASVARKGAQAVRSRPFAAGAIAATVGLVLARGWIIDAVRSRKETPAPSAGLKRKDTKGTRA